MLSHGTISALRLAVRLGIDPSAKVVARLLDAPEAGARRAAAEALAAEGDFAPLDRAVAELFAKRRTELRRRIVEGGVDAARGLAPALRGLSDAALWRLGFAPTRDGGVALFFDADPRWDRRRALEYLVCLDPPPEGVASKAHETLAGMAASEFAAFRAHAAGRSPVLLRWWAVGGALVTVRLLEALPGATLRFSDPGLSLGADRDERANAKLPPDGAPLQVGA